MATTARRVFGVTELLEEVLVHLPPIDILRFQQVCHAWKQTILNSKSLLRALWYLPNPERSTSEFTMNPFLFDNHLNIDRRLKGQWAFYEDEAKPFDTGEISLTKVVYHEPGSWTTMLLTQPPCRYVEVTCYSDYIGEEIMYYCIESMDGCLLMGDLMTILAEAQNRQSYGVDRWAGVQHYSAHFSPVANFDDDGTASAAELRRMDDNVSVRVVVGQAWDSGEYPAFSLRRMVPAITKGAAPGPQDSQRFLHEMIVHEMREVGGIVYVWDRSQIYHPDPVYKTGKYQPKMLAVKEHEGKYLEACEQKYQLLSEV